MTRAPQYLDPYLHAAQLHGGGFGSLLWASPHTQAARFGALARLFPPHGLRVVDVGCGRADFLTFLLARRITPLRYVGIEAVPDLLDAARAQVRPTDLVVADDFIANPRCMLVDADVATFSGSLNTAADAEFFGVLRQAYHAAARGIVFNFLCSPSLAGARYLYWRRPADVLAFARSLGGVVTACDDYLPGDMTIAVRKRLS